MFSKVKNVLEKMYSFIYWKFFRARQREKNAKHKSYSVKEIFMQQNREGGYNRLDTVVRYLAIENYYGKNDYGFALYRKMQNGRIEEGYDEVAIKKFIELIKSFEHDGYDESSEILLDSNLMLLDGSHRMACSLYWDIDEVACKIYEETSDIRYGIEWFVKNNFTLEEIEKITFKCNELIKKCMKPISLILWPPVAPYFNEIISKISYMCDDVENIRVIEYSDVIFERVVRAIYHVDDVATYKIDKKIEYMSKWNKCICVADIYFREPVFRRKGINDNSILYKGEVIKDSIRNCYKEKIDEYFYDIIIHTADNYTQSEYINHILSEKISLREFFYIINKYEWMLIKTDVEYMPKDFPDTVPFSKDIDMITSNDDFMDIADVAWKYMNKMFANQYEIRKIEKEDRTKIRLERNGFLIIQVDISRRVEGISQQFVNESLKRRYQKDGYFIASEADEVYYRMNELKKNPSKVWHKKWIGEHIDLYDEQYFIKLRECK